MGQNQSGHTAKDSKYAPSASVTQQQATEGPYQFRAFGNKYESLEMVQDGLRKSGLESSNLVVGIDYTISNQTAGVQTYGGKSLHSIEPGLQNPYQTVIGTIGRTLEVFDDDKLIPAFGFGDATTKENSVFSLTPDGSPCAGFNGLLQRYSEVTPNVKMAGPTSFAPIIRQTIGIVQRSRGYHILLIVADGQVTPDNPEYGCRTTSDTVAAIVEASNYPISIIVVGVGDGPWDMMDDFDKNLPQRKFDNFHFVEFHKVWALEGGDVQRKDTSFAVSALQEIPDQYLAIRKLRYIQKCGRADDCSAPTTPLFSPNTARATSGC